MTERPPQEARVKKDHRRVHVTEITRIRLSNLVDEQTSTNYEKLPNGTIFSVTLIPMPMEGNAKSKPLTQFGVFEDGSLDLYPNWQEASQRANTPNQ